MPTAKTIMKSKIYNSSLVFLSLSDLLTCSDHKILLSQLMHRNSLQLTYFNELPKTREIKVLIRLNQDSIDISNVIYKKYISTNITSNENRLIGVWLQSLSCRHSLFTETLSDFCLNSYFHKNESIIYKILACQCSYTCILEHFTGKYHSNYENFIHSTSIMKLCEDSKFHAINLAEHQENWSPRIDINYSNITLYENKVNYIIPSRVKFVLIEVLKNALAATIKQYNHEINTLKMKGLDFQDEIMNIPSVQVIIEYDKVTSLELQDSPQKIIITVIDQGIGMTSHQLSHAFRFLYFSTMKASEMVTQQLSYQPHSAPLQGLGCGLSMSKLFMQQFNGDLYLDSAGPGCGTTCTIVINTNILEKERDFIML